MDLTDDQWKIVSTILPEDPIRDDKRGRPWSDRRTVLNGVLWILRTGAPWKDMPSRYGPYQTAHRRFQNWVRSGGDRENSPRAGRAPQGGRRPGSQRVFCGWDFRTRQKRGLCVGKTKRGKGTKIMGIADSHGLPIALRTENASPAEVKLVAATLDDRVVEDVPERLIGDKAYDSDGLDKQLMEAYGTEMISPHRQGRKTPTQDGRPLRRYIRRWKVERMFAWLFNFRRLVVRYEYHSENFQGFLHLAAAIILLRHL